MNDTGATSQSGASLLPDGIGALTTLHLVIVALLAIAAIAVIVVGMRRARIRRQAERDRAARRVARERLQALRGERRDFDAGLQVVVAEAPALAGKVGRIVEALGRTALVSFGGAYAWEIEAWRLSPFDVDEAAARKSIAA